MLAAMAPWYNISGETMNSNRNKRVSCVVVILLSSVATTTSLFWDGAGRRGLPNDFSSRVCCNCN
jgi:hypothetical protein